MKIYKIWDVKLLILPGQYFPEQDYKLSGALWNGDNGDNKQKKFKGNIYREESNRIIWDWW